MKRIILILGIIAIFLVAGCTGQSGPASSKGSEGITGTPTCTPNWQCGTWSECSTSGTQTRTCTDSNNCGTLASKPSESQGCTSPCTSIWQCSNWSECSSGTQERLCVDSKGCNIAAGKPIESQTCTIPTPAPIFLSGTSQQATQKFRLEKGLSIFNMQHTGTSNFAIWLMDSSGQRADLLVNEIGSFDGSKVEGIETAGDYILDISADGSWNVNIQQPRPTTAPSIPKVLSGTGQKASDMFYLNSGLVTFRMKHYGSRNFAIWLYDSSGNRVDLLVNEIGAFDGSKAEGISKSGIYILDITADGNWQVSIE